MAIEMGNSTVVCYKCGTGYSRKKGFFPVSYAPLYKGVGYIPICRECLDSMYSLYLLECKDQRTAMRQMCRKLDLYWSDYVYDLVDVKSTTRSLLTKYLAKLNSSAYVGKCYDDTLKEEGMLWRWKLPDGSDNDLSLTSVEQQKASVHEIYTQDDESPILIEVPEDFEVTNEIVQFWGSGYTKTVYAELEQRRKYWMGMIGNGQDLDAGAEAIIRQICSLELDINRDRIAGKSVEKSVNVLNTLLGSANLKPSQRKDDTDGAIEDTPMGVWIWRYENERPLPETDPELKDVDGIKRYLTIWVFGHLCKMLNIRNSYCRLYEEEMAKLRVERPEYEDEDDDSLLYDVFSDDVDSADDG